MIMNLYVIYDDRNSFFFFFEWLKVGYVLIYWLIVNIVRVWKCMIKNDVNMFFFLKF